jgi:hypothetical protein
MARGHPNGNQVLEVDDTAFVELMQQNDEKLKQRHTDGQTADVCQFMAYLIGCQTALEKAFSDKNKDVPGHIATPGNDVAQIF